MTLLRSAVCLSGILFLSLFASARPSGPWDRFDVLHYDLAVHFDAARETFGGSVGVTALRRAPGNEMLLHAYQPLLTIDSVMHGALKLPFSRSGDTLTIRLASLGKRGDTVRVRVYYRGSSTFHGEYDNGGVYFSRDDLGNAHIATMGEPSFARRWWPCKDVPSDKATATVTATVPLPLTAVSNGLLTSVTDGKGERSFRWETRYPIATYLVSVAAAPYETFSQTYTALDGTTMPIQYYVYKKDLEKARRDFSDTPAILRFFAERFGEYPFLNEKFGYAEVDGDLTMENQTLVSVQGTLITGTGEHEMTFVHELSHHWWGDLVTPTTWNHTWLNEGFGTYAEALYREHESGAPAYAAYMDTLMRAPVGAFKGSVIGRSDTAFWDSFGARVYFKGAIVLHMLRAMMGDSMFFQVMRTHLQNPLTRYGNATTQDFIRECEAAYGKDLGWFFDQWIFASPASIDRPTLKLDWSAVPSGSSYDVTVTVIQKYAAELLYRLPFNVTLAGGGQDRVFPVVDSLDRQTFRWTVPLKPDRVVLDKEHRLFFDLQQ